jgi:hypothetical protein
MRLKKGPPVLRDGIASYLFYAPTAERITAAPARSRSAAPRSARAPRAAIPGWSAAWGSLSAFAVVVRGRVRVRKRRMKRCRHRRRRRLLPSRVRGCRNGVVTVRIRGLLPLLLLLLLLLLRVLRRRSPLLLQPLVPVVPQAIMT